MNNSLVRLDLTQIFCDIDDFYQVLNRIGEGTPKLPYDGEAKSYNSKLSLSEVMYNRFVELMPWSLMGMIVFPQYLRGRDDRH
jgi:hypothetical protein